ncbi:MAG: ATP-binding protein [Gemmatimonadaceae bacterium]|nr:ATP-binding protein [Gemmatimonadaceae bacterium]
MPGPRDQFPEARILEFEIPSDVRFIERVVEAVRAECRTMCYTERHVALNVPVALTEALSNAILRGNGERRDRSVLIRAHVGDVRLIMEVTDEGQGFDLDACLMDPTTPERLLSEDGRGLYLMLKLMDHVERVQAQRGNLVRMILNRAS